MWASTKGSTSGNQSVEQVKPKQKMNVDVQVGHETLSLEESRKIINSGRIILSKIHCSR